MFSTERPSRAALHPKLPALAIRTGPTHQRSLDVSAYQIPEINQQKASLDRKTWPVSLCFIKPRLDNIQLFDFIFKKKKKIKLFFVASGAFIQVARFEKKKAPHKRFIFRYEIFSNSFPLGPLRCGCCCC